MLPRSQLHIMSYYPYNVYYLISMEGMHIRIIKYMYIIHLNVSSFYKMRIRIYVSYKCLTNRYIWPPASISGISVNSSGKTTDVTFYLKIPLVFTRIKYLLSFPFLSKVRGPKGPVEFNLEVSCTPH